jgi:pimeloyl-ACP methyl ester carboxylesterase
MKKIILGNLLLLSMGLSLKVNAQNNSPGFGQMVNAFNYQGKNFKFTCSTLIPDRSNSNSIAFTACYDDQGKWIRSFLGEPSSNFSDGWSNLSVSGKLPKNTSKVFVGILLNGKGNYYYDNFRLTYNGIDDQGIVKNGDFEDSKVALSPYGAINHPKDSARVIQDPRASDNHILEIVINSRGSNENTFGNNESTGAFVSVNGVNLYYETYGNGTPLLLLHGALESISSYSAIIPILTKKFKVIALDTRGHGKSTADSTRLSYELYADDVYKFLDKLGLDSVNVLGWSDGGNTGLILAMNHPKYVRRLAVMGANLYNKESSIPNWVNDTLRSQILFLEQNPGDSRDDFELRVKKTLLTEPNIDPSSLGKIQCKTLVMAGEKDVIKEKHTRLIANSIKDSKLVIFRKASHYAPVEIPEKFAATVIDFF